MIELRGVNKHYRGAEDLHILRDINLNVTKGDFAAIIGPSGSGKSTLMNVIGLLDAPTSGAYMLEQLDVSLLSDMQAAKVRSRKIGFVFQQFNLLARLNALENVELPMIYAGMPKKERRERALHLLEMLGLDHRFRHRPAELSGGQQQRVAIARALANDPVLLLADEPTGALDTKTGHEVLELLLRLNEQGNTILLITHDPQIAGYTKRTVTLQDGSIVRDAI
ncbi:ABC transporter ATP-binding protein [Paenibacillus sp. sptzw28]|nr:ABC transporter ATP-binding protein [Paenibacillus sp. sptzw28]